MNRTMKIILPVLCLYLCVFWFGCRPGSGDTRNPTIEELSNALMYTAVLDRLSNVQWEREDDPRTIMMYCDALVETRKPLPEAMISPPVPQHVSKFTRGYYSFRQGKLREGLKIFSEIVEDKKHHVWGDLGVLVFSLETSSIANAKRPLDVLEREAGRDPALSQKWNLPFYRTWYNFYCGRYDEVDKILRDYEDNLDARGLSELKVTMLLMKDKFSEAERMIRRMSPGYQWTAVLESELIKLKYGHQKWLEFLREKRKQYPRFWMIESKYADALVESGQIDSATKIRKKLVEVRPYDFLMQLALAAHILYHGNFEDARGYLLRLDYPPEVSYYDVLLSEMYSRQNQAAKAWECLKLAKKLFPKSPYVLTGIMGMALNARDYDMAYRAVKEKLEIDPNDIETLVLAMLVYCLRREYNEVLRVETQIEGSRRHIDKEIKEKIESLKTQCIR